MIFLVTSSTSHFAWITIMAVHSLHIFDRKGKTLYTKRYAAASASAESEDPEQLSEQRKLVFGMIFSLREIAKMLAPPTSNDNSGLHSVKTGASTLHNYETSSGLRFALYTTPGANNSQTNGGKAERAALSHIYDELWIQCVTRSPLYIPTSPNVAETNFEQKLDAFLKSQPWFA
jgi:trafficking protein particle complex subunit 1